MEFNEQHAIEHMRNSLPSGVNYDDDELLNIIDMIWDYYEQNGLLDIDVDDEEDALDISNELNDYCRRMLAKDKYAVIDANHIEVLVNAELEYERSLENCL